MNLRFYLSHDIKITLKSHLWRENVKILPTFTQHYGLQSKRPQVKTSPSQNVPKSVKTSPKIGQNIPMVKKCWSKRPQNEFIFYML